MKDGPIKTSLKAAMDETEMVIFDCVDNLLKKTGVSPSEVCILVTLTSILSSTEPD